MFFVLKMPLRNEKLTFVLFNPKVTFSPHGNCFSKVLAPSSSRQMAVHLVIGKLLIPNGTSYIAFFTASIQNAFGLVLQIQVVLDKCLRNALCKCTTLGKYCIVQGGKVYFL